LDFLLKKAEKINKSCLENKKRIDFLSRMVYTVAKVERNGRKMMKME